MLRLSKRSCVFGIFIKIFEIDFGTEEKDLQQCLVKFLNSNKIPQEQPYFTCLLMEIYFSNGIHKILELKEEVKQNMDKLLTDYLRRNDLFYKNDYKALNILFKVLLIIQQEIDCKNEFKLFISKYNKMKKTNPYIESSQWEKYFQQELRKENIKFIKDKSIGPYLIDFFVEPNICININGPSHYIGDSKLPMVKDKMRDLILKMKGYTTFTIPFFKWKRGTESKEDKIMIELFKILKV